MFSKLMLFALALFCALSFVGLIFLALRIGGAGKLRFKAAHCSSRLESRDYNVCELKVELRIIDLQEIWNKQSPKIKEAKYLVCALALRTNQ